MYRVHNLKTMLHEHLWLAYGTLAEEKSTIKAGSSVSHWR